MGSEKDISIRLSLKDGEPVRRALMQLGEDGQEALAKIEDQSKPASKGLLAVDAVTGELREGISDMADRLGPIGTGLGALGPAGLAAAAGIGAAVAALAGLVRASVDAAEELAAIKDEAQQAGAAVETYQALRYAAEEYSVSQDALTDGLKELNLRIDEWVTTGGGAAAEAFARLGFSQEELQGKLGDTGELLLDVVGRMEGLETEAARIRVADEIFGGTGGEQFVRMVAGGAGAIRDLMDEARDLGYVMDESLIERADEARDRMAQLQRLIGVSFNSALLELVPIAEDVAEAFADVAKWIRDVADGFRDLENQSDRSIQRQLAKLDEFFAAHPNQPRDGHKLRDWQKKSKKRERLQQIKTNIAAPENQQAGSPVLGGATSDGQEEADGIRKVSDALRFQLEQLNRTEIGKRVFQALQDAGIDINHEEAHTIRELVTQLYPRQQAEEAARKAKADGEAMTKSVMTAEEKRAEAMRDIAKLLEDGVITEETAARKREETARAFEDAERRRLMASRDAADGIKRAMMDVRDASTVTAQRWVEDIQGMNQTARSAFVDITTGAKTMSEGLQSILGDLQRRIMGRVYDRMVGSLFDGILDGVFGANHGGGMVGDPTFFRRVNPLAFAGAPHFHGGGMVPGLRPGETPIIAMRGERVLTEAQQDNTARTIAGLAAAARPPSPGVSVVVNNNAGQVAQARAQVSQGRDGGLNLEVVVEEIENRMSRNVGRGEGMAPTLERRYGLDPAAGARR